MAKPRLKQISDQQTAYLQLLITDLNADNKKLALETISKLYRSGYRFRNPERILPAIVFLCNDEHDKVRRWAFNALALVGTRREVPNVVAALTREVANPDILAAVIVALSALGTEDETRAALTRANLPLEGFALLAAAQQSPLFSAELAKTRVDIDSASVSELRLATLLLGLRKAPEHMFSGRHPNSDVIGELNPHPDPLVSQYSVWAAYEDPSMTLSNLRIKARDIGNYHSGIRKYGFRLMTEDAATAQVNREYIEAGARDPSREAREGLATGFRSTFFNGAEEITLPWFRDEETATVRDRLLEHMATCSEQCDKYVKPVSDTYEWLNNGSLGRARLEAAASGTRLYSRLKTIEYRAGKYDMFDEELSSKTNAGTLDPLKAKVLIVTPYQKKPLPS